MPFVTLYNNQPVIELKVNIRTITKFGLQRIIYDSYLINHPTVTNTYANLDSDGTIKYPFTFPPLFNKYSEVQLSQFLNLFEHIAKEIGQRHYDDILFLTYSYILNSQEKDRSTLMENTLRERGKLLLQFIRVPIPMLNQNNIYTAFEHDPYLSEEADQYILAYLGILSGKDEKYFKNGNSIDFNNVDDELWIKLTRRIQQDRNISVEIDNDKYLTISRNINLNFNYKQAKKSSVALDFTDRSHKNHLLTILVNDLFKEQKEKQTPFYYVLMKHDFIINTDYRLLSKSLGLYDRSEQKTYNLKTLHSLIIEYLDTEKVLLFESKPDTNRIRNNFIYQYFILIGLINKNKDAEPDNIKHLANEITNFELKKKANPNYASITLRGSFKNLKVTKKGAS